MIRRTPSSTLCPYTTLLRSARYRQACRSSSSQRHSPCEVERAGERDADRDTCLSNVQVSTCSADSKVANMDSSGRRVRSCSRRTSATDTDSICSSCRGRQRARRCDSGIRSYCDGRGRAGDGETSRSSTRQGNASSEVERTSKRHPDRDACLTNIQVRTSSTNREVPYVGYEAGSVSVTTTGARDGDTVGSRSGRGWTARTSNSARTGYCQTCRTVSSKTSRRRDYGRECYRPGEACHRSDRDR